MLLFSFGEPVRNKVVGNIVLGVSVLLFVAIAVVEIRDLF
jgi:hypothetical protein